MAIFVDLFTKGNCELDAISEVIEEIAEARTR
jgi:hypothetical protein